MKNVTTSERISAAMELVAGVVVLGGIAAVVAYCMGS